MILLQLECPDAQLPSRRSFTSPVAMVLSSRRNSLPVGVCGKVSHRYSRSGIL